MQKGVDVVRSNFFYGCDIFWVLHTTFWNFCLAILHNFALFLFANICPFLNIFAQFCIFLKFFARFHKFLSIFWFVHTIFKKIATQRAAKISKSWQCLWFDLTLSAYLCSFKHSRIWQMRRNCNLQKKITLIVWLHFEENNSNVMFFSVIFPTVWQEITWLFDSFENPHYTVIRLLTELNVQSCYWY